MSFFQYKSNNVHYIQKGQGPSVLILHGWGTNLESFRAIIDELSQNYQVTALDFPGFGQSEEPKSVFTLSDYADMTEAIIQELKLENPVVMGHSFGGRVAIKLNSRVHFSKIILVGSAGIKPKRKSNYYFKVYGFKFIRTLGKFPIFSWILKEPIQAYSEKYSSFDYKQASPMMKRVLSSVVNEDLQTLLPMIKVPTLLIWGDQDTATPLEDAKLMEKSIEDSGLVVFEGSGHFTYLEQPTRFMTIIKTFIGGN